MLRTAILNAVFLIFGLILGALFFGDSSGGDGELAPRDPGAETIELAGPERLVGQDLPTGDEDGANEDDEGGVESPGTPESESPVDTGELARVLDRIPREPAEERGQETITGRVLTPEGQPMEGVLVRAYSRRIFRNAGMSRRRKGLGVLEDASLESKVASMVKTHRNALRNRRESRTDRNGEYVLSGLRKVDDVQYYLNAFAQGYEIRSKQRSSSGYYNAGDRVDFEAKAVIDISVEILLPGGESPDTATVHYTPMLSGKGRSSSPWNPEDPIIQLNPGHYVLEASATTESGEEFKSEKQELNLVAGQPPGPIRFQLAGRAGIRGQVIFAEGQEFPHMYVCLLPGASGQNAPRDVWLRNGKRDTIDPRDPAFSFKDLAPGLYSLGYSIDLRSGVFLVDTIEVSDHSVQRDIEIPPFEPTEYVIVWVLAPDGEVLDDARVSTGYRFHRGLRSANALKRDDGSFFSVHALPPDGEEDEDLDYYVRVSSREFGEKEVKYRPGEIEEIHVQFVEPAMLEISLPGYAGSRAEGLLSLSLSQVSEDKTRRSHGTRIRSETALDGRGRQTFGPAEPGKYELVLTVQPDRSFRIPVTSQTISLESGFSSLDVSLPELYDLTVLFPDDIPASTQLRITFKQFSESGTRHYGASKVVGKDARVELKNLPRGEYKFSISGTTNEMEVALTGDREVLFEPVIPNAFRVKPTDAEGYLASTGIKNGDLIIGYDQTSIEGATEINNFYQAIHRRASATLVILRGNQRLEIVVNPRKMMGRNGGGSLYPTQR